MLTIEIKLNGRFIAGAKVRNVSDLANLSDYEVEAVEQGSYVTGLPDFHREFKVETHNRKQTVWALVQKVARMAVVHQVRDERERTGEKPKRKRFA